MKILIVDDEFHIRILLRKLISEFDLETEIVGEAEDGGMALKLCRILKPDLVISDIRMPIFSGIELIKELKNIDENIFCVFISAYTDFEYAQSAIKYGAIAYILKPIKESELYEVLRNSYVLWKKKCKQRTDMRRVETEIRKLQIVHNVEIPNDLDVKYSRHVQRSLAYINDHYNENISLDSMVVQVFLNKNYFSEMFHREVGKTFIQYLTDYRIQKAKLLLEIENFKIVEIAHMTGFSNNSYFIRIFKKFEGKTPSEYRKEKLKAEGE